MERRKRRRRNRRRLTWIQAHRQQRTAFTRAQQHNRLVPDRLDPTTFYTNAAPQSEVDAEQPGQRADGRARDRTIECAAVRARIDEDARGPAKAADQWVTRVLADTVGENQSTQSE